MAALLAKWGVPPTALELEITESAVMADPGRAMAVLQLQALGISLAIDDFGTGYSSLSYLSRLPVANLKIDKSFVTNMATNEHDAVIVRPTIDLGRNLGLRVIAEGSIPSRPRPAWSSSDATWPRGTTSAGRSRPTSCRSGWRPAASASGCTVVTGQVADEHMVPLSQRGENVWRPLCLVVLVAIVRLRSMVGHREIGLPGTGRGHGRFDREILLGERHLIGHR